MHGDGVCDGLVTEIDSRVPGSSEEEGVFDGHKEVIRKACGYRSEQESLLSAVRGEKRQSWEADS